MAFMAMVLLAFMRGMERRAAISAAVPALDSQLKVKGFMVSGMPSDCKIVLLRPGMTALSWPMVLSQAFIDGMPQRTTSKVMMRKGDQARMIRERVYRGVSTGTGKGLVFGCQYFNKTIQKILQTDSDPFSFKGLKYIKSVDQSKGLNYRNNPMVIISASGMADAGRVKHHISNNIENTRNSIVMTGYCEPNSLGGRLIAGATEVSIFGVEHQVNAEIGSIRSMSAHGDYEDLSQWLACQDPRQVKQLFLVHGEYEVQQEFKRRLVKKGFLDVQIPERHFEIGLG